MGFNCGIVGLPNVGKSTIFNALTAQHVPAENYPFCTTDHNTGVVSVPDKRLDDIAKIFKPERVVPTHIEFVDIAGLVAGAHSGEGLGNKFLGHIRNVDAIAQVVRCFNASDVVHPYPTIDPIRDLEVVETEMVLADLEIVDKLLIKHQHASKGGEKHEKEIVEVLTHLKGALEKGITIKKSGVRFHEVANLIDLPVTTDKPSFVIANVDEDEIRNPKDEAVKKLEEFCKKRGEMLLRISAKIESELVELSPDERTAFRSELGVPHSSLEQIIQTGYSILNLITFFTKESSEVRAWTVPKGTKAPQAAGRIHTDFEKGFVRAEVYGYSDLMKYGSEHSLREHGHLKIEGHEYEVKDGDILQFRFTS